MEQQQSHLALFQAAEVTLVYKTKVNVADRPVVKTSKEAYGVLVKIWDAGKIEFIEQFNVLFLNRCSKVIGIYRVSTGGISGTVADPRIIFAAAIKANAHGIILSHNHPSGNLRPSWEDISLTNKIRNAGMFLDIDVIDHLIISSEGYYSFREVGALGG